MLARRPLAVARRIAAAAVVALALASCQRPAPSVTVVSGTTSVNKEADVWCFPGQSQAQSNCARRDASVPALAVTPGQRVGVDVGKDVAKRGWLVQLSTQGGQPQSSEVLVDKYYFAFTAPNAGGTLRLVVRAVDPQDAAGGASGQWTFDLTSK